MRIVMVNKFARVTGGADRHCLRLASALRERGHDVKFLSTESSENQEHDGVFIRSSLTHTTRDTLPRLEKARIAGRALWNLKAAEGMKVLLDDFQPHIVHAHKLYPQLSAAPVLAAAGRGVPIVQTIHDYEFVAASALDDSGAWIDRHETKLSYRLLNTATHSVRRYVHGPAVSLWIAISRFMAGVYAARGIQALVLPNYCEIRNPASSAAFEERRGIVFLGRLTEEKGIRDVLNLARKLEDVPVLIAGDGPLRPLVERAAGIQANLTFLGFVDPNEAISRLAAARVAVMPSRWQEPGGVAALEAMSVGTPVVAYDRGGLTEYVRRAGGGEIVSDPKALIHACQNLYRDPTKWQRLSEAGVAGIAARHSLKEYIDRLETGYRDVAQHVSHDG
jgi:glycosyltransferase involved in cell wall biosynthesis